VISILLELKENIEKELKEKFAENSETGRIMLRRRIARHNLQHADCS